MAVTPNSLLQATAQASAKSKTQAAPASPLASVAEPGDKASSFAQLYAKESQSKPQARLPSVADNSPKPVRDKPGDNSPKKDVGNDSSAAPQPVVADSGKSLPADKPASSDNKTSSSDNKTASTDTSKSADTAQTDTPPPSDPVLDPSLVQLTPPAPVVPAEALPATPEPVPVPAPQVEAAPAVPVPAIAAAIVAPAPEPAKPEFDPEADPLDALPAVRLAMEQGGHVSATSQAQPKAAPSSAGGDMRPIRRRA